MANLLYHLSGLNKINSCDVEFGSLQHFACKVSELYPIPTRYYVRAVARNYILFLFSFWSGRFMDNIQLSHQLLNSFCNSLKLNLGKVRGSILKLFLTSLCLTRLHYDSPVSSLLIKLVQFVCLMDNWCNQPSKIPYWTLLWYPLILWKHLSLWLASVLSWKSSPR